jgi:DNA-directed RNA polymerase sigma subunit (sigma70/sigma32)
VQSALYELVERLPQRLRWVIIARYGLAGKPAAIYAEIGAMLGRSGERARQLHLEALVWLRHPAHSQQLRALLGRHTLADYEWADAQAQRWLRRRRGGRYGGD